MEAAGRLWTYGFPVSVSTVNNLQHSEKEAVGYISNVPLYPFDCSLTHWYESRFSRDFRMREPMPEQILGARSYDWNPLEPKWRKILSIKDIPWISDHVVGDTVVYPGAGTLVMALEAVKQHAASLGTYQTLSGYLIKEAEFLSSIVIRSGAEGSAEVLISLRPVREFYGKASGRHEVRVTAHGIDQWNGSFRATIFAEHKETPTPINNGFEATETAAACVRSSKHAEKACIKRIEKEKVFLIH